MKMNFLRSIKHECREKLSTSALGVKLLAIFGSWGHARVRQDSRVCIEAYPRSANTFSIAAFRISQDDFSCHIGRHSHMAGQVKLALQYGVPVAVIIREPLAAAASLKVFAPYLTTRQCLKDYIRFYQALDPIRDKFVCLKFEDVIADYNVVLQGLSEKFGVDYNNYCRDEVTEAACFSLVGEMDKKVNKSDTITATQVARPNEDRRALNDLAKKKMLSPQYERLRAKAEAVYKSYM